MFIYRPGKMLVGCLFILVVIEKKFVVTKTNISDDLRDSETKGQKNYAQSEHLTNTEWFIRYELCFGTVLFYDIQTCFPLIAFCYMLLDVLRVKINAKFQSKLE